MSINKSKILKKLIFRSKIKFLKVNQKIKRDMLTKKITGEIKLGIFQFPLI